MTHGPTAAFTAGEQIAHRSVDQTNGIVLTVLPQIVVRDDPRLIATYMPAGSLTKRRTGDRSGGPRGRQLMTWDGGHEDRPWTGTSVLMLHCPGDGFSLWRAWDADRWLPAWWYLNIEEPWRRTAIGFDTRDLWLDLWSEPDRREWHWKDEDELAWAVEQGRCGAAGAASIRTEGERALRRMQRGDPPFDQDWSGWRPDPRWPIPSVPLAWDRLQQE